MSFVREGPFHTHHLHPGILLLSLPKNILKIITSTLIHAAATALRSIHNASSAPPFPVPHPRSSKVQRIHTHTNEKDYKNKNKDPFWHNAEAQQ